jgi:hypothetical protein
MTTLTGATFHACAADAVDARELLWDAGITCGNPELGRYASHHSSATTAIGTITMRSISTRHSIPAGSDSLECTLRPW